MPQIHRVDVVRQTLKTLRKRSKAKNHPSYIVGYSANYALHVHEDLEARHAPGKSAKFLEKPARELREELARIIRTVTAQTGSMEAGVQVAALRLQRASQKIVPVSGWHPQISPPNQGSGNLKGSAFTRKE